MSSSVIFLDLPQAQKIIIPILFWLRQANWCQTRQG
jgi:hypothetical protein